MIYQNKINNYNKKKYLYVGNISLEKMVIPKFKGIVVFYGNPFIIIYY